MAATFSNIFAELLDAGIEPVEAARLAIEATKAENAMPAKAKTQKLGESAKKESIMKSADPKKGEALLSTCKFKVEKTVRTDDGVTPVWRVSLSERIAKSDWADLSKYMSETFYASYWRGAWSFCFNPATVLKGGKLSPSAKKAIEAKKAEVAKAKEAKKAKKTEVAKATTAKKAKGKKSA